MRPLSLLTFIVVFYTLAPASGFVPRTPASVVAPVRPKDDVVSVSFLPKARVFDSAQAPLMAEPGTTANSNKLPFWLDPGTKGGAMFLSLVLFIIPVIVYIVATSVFGADEIETGITIGVGFTVVATVAWVSTYIFRVATKDMTYAKQLKEYEDAVIAKRLEELDEDEIVALQEEIERDDF